MQQTTEYKFQKTKDGWIVIKHVRDSEGYGQFLYFSRHGTWDNAQGSIQYFDTAKNAMSAVAHGTYRDDMENR